MPARILDGTKIANDIRSELAADIKSMSAAGVRPGLAVVLAGHNPASEIYVRSKVKACEELGIFSVKLTPPDTVTTQELLHMVAELNARDDVDGFHPVNVGRLSTQRPGLFPCTPSGVIEILRRSQIPIAGKHAVVLGRSDIVGKPMAMLLLNRDATVTICHSK